MFLLSKLLHVLYEIIIFNFFQLSKLKSDLNDALYSDKWTPDAYLLAKSYMAEEMPSTARYTILVNIFIFVVIEISPSCRFGWV